jgi:hypothetical protein
MTTPENVVMMVTIGMAPDNHITMALMMNGKPLGHINLDRASAENIIAGLQTHIGYLKEEKFDA